MIESNRADSNNTTAMIVVLTTILVVVADQVIKFWVKTRFYLGEEMEILPWFRLKFIENNGMAFGMQLWNKLFLTFGRIAAVGLFIWMLVKLVKMPGIRRGFMVALALITAGAAGNIFDCVFYGEIFNNPMPPQVAELFPKGGGYAGWFEGRVVDMFYFPICSWVWPSWLPGIGGKEFEFFQYIFNLADSAICIGVFMLIFFYSESINSAYRFLSDKGDKSGKKVK